MASSSFTLALISVAALGLAATGCSGGESRGKGPAGAGGTPTAIPDGGSAFDVCFADLAAAGSWFTEVQGFQTADDSIRLWRARRPGSRSSVGETFPYDLVRFAVESDDDVACVAAPGALTYEFGHHNWDESWTAETALRTYSVTEALTFDEDGTTWTDALTVTTAAGAPVLGPVTLEPTACFSVPYNLNPCMSRERTDSPPEGFGE